MLIKKLLQLFAEKFLISKKGYIQTSNQPDLSRAVSYDNDFTAPEDGYVRASIKCTEIPLSCYFQEGASTFFEIGCTNLGWNTTAYFKVSKGMHIVIRPHNETRGEVVNRVFYPLK